MSGASAGCIASIVMASFNKGRFLELALRSALAQGDSVEVIVVDDASTDGSLEIARAVAEGQPRLKVIGLPRNVGGAHCRNLGLREAEGAFVTFLDADDLLKEGAMSRRIRTADRFADHDLWVFPMETFREDPSTPVGRWTPRPGPHLLNFLAHRLDWSIMQPLWRRSFLESIGGFDESFTRLQDPELHVRALIAGARVMCLPEADADCLYRIDTERHRGDPVPLVQRHVDGSVHFYRVFAAKVRGRQHRALSGTLHSALAVLDHRRRIGEIDERTAAALGLSIIRQCEVPWHRLVMRGFMATSRVTPTRLPGLNWACRMLLRL